MSTMASVNERRVVVSGAAGGIGSAIARRLAGSGWTVGLMDRNAADLARIADDIAGPHAILVADIRDPMRVNKEVEGFVGEGNTIDGVVLAAGVAAKGSIRDTPLSAWAETIDVNLTGSFVVAQACLRFMTNGAIVMISSVQALAGWPNQAAYAASKGGLVALARQMAVDLAGDRITVNVVCPGTIDTAMLRGKQPVTAELEHRWHTQQPIQRIGVPNDVAGIVQFLLSVDATWITGQTFVVDGGHLAAGKRG